MLDTKELFPNLKFEMALSHYDKSVTKEELTASDMYKNDRI